MNSEEIHDSLVSTNSPGRLLVVTHHLPVQCILKDYISKSTLLYSSLPRSIAKKLNLKSLSGNHAAKPKGLPLWEIGLRRGHTALFSGIRSLGTHTDVLHIGWTGMMQDHDLETFDSSLLTANLRLELTQKLYDEKKCIPVYYNDKVAAAHYEGYCKGNLWPIFHYQLWDQVTNGSEESRNWDAYVAVNQAFADMVIKTYQNGDTIWIHDYHLMLVPSMLRKMLPKATIGFFLHTPFPSSELFRCLPSMIFSF